jgi:(p)ppGpp synthase/HD superfamily hydrolase
MEKLLRAINFAAIAHREQRRKDEKNTPYVNHPIEVMALLSAGGIADIDTLCAAVLHDTVEDVGITYEQLIAEFGENVANIVRECSDDKSLSKVTRKELQIVHSKDASVAAKLVKAADKLSNLSGLDTQPPAKWSKEEIEGYFAWSYAVWRNIRGQNSYIDGKLEQLFAGRKLLDVGEEELKNMLTLYYSKIEHSE